MKITEKIMIDRLARQLKDEYEATQDKYLLCLDALDMSFQTDGENRCDYWVGKLEDAICSL